MKRYGNLFDQFCSFENLYLATQKAQKGKRYKHSTVEFNYDQESNLKDIQNKLMSEKYSFGSYYNFYVYDPKKRLISAPPYPDRVVHHAVCNIIEPIFERTFIYDQYSNRKNKGTHKAVNKYQQFCRLNKYVLKCDIRKYFENINKDILYKAIEKKIKDHKLLKVIKDIIFSYNPDKPGIPLGNLTSQYFANIYLNDFDHFIKETLHCRYYIRYVDDFVIFNNCKTNLHLIKDKLEKYLNAIGLELHKNKSHVRMVKEGVSFLGYRIFPDHRLINKMNVKRFKRKLKRLQLLYANNRISRNKIFASLQSWNAHASNADSYKLRQELFDKYTFVKG